MVQKLTRAVSGIAVNLRIGRRIAADTGVAIAVVARRGLLNEEVALDELLNEIGRAGVARRELLNRDRP